MLADKFWFWLDGIVECHSSKKRIDKPRARLTRTHIDYDGLTEQIHNIFGVDITEGVLRQRLLMTTIKEVLEEMGIIVRRSGDDLYIGDKKLSVSICTKSMTSILIHTGLNIDSEGAPIKAGGLKTDLNIDDVDTFAKKVMKRYSEELDDIYLAGTKVRGVTE